MARFSTLIGVGGAAILVVLSGVAVAAGLWKVLAVAWIAFGSMAGAAALGRRNRSTTAQRLVWGYGIASGAMITSAAVFLVPQAMGPAPRFGGFGIAGGILLGYSGHTTGHRLSHLELPMDRTVAELSAHALAAGTIIGLVYGSMPALGLLLGVAIVSHKAPAGYAAARRLARGNRAVAPVLLPAAGVGITAIPAALLPIPQQPIVHALVFGFASGVFLHVAMDFLPNCEVGGEIDQVAGVTEHSHELLDRLRVHAVASTILGSVAVFLAWVATTL
jgi:ZIP family zinc transporter